MLTHSPALILYTWLKPLPPPCALFYANMPPDPECLTLYEAEGILQGRGQRTGRQFAQHGIKAHARGRSSDVCRSWVVWLDRKIYSLRSNVIIDIGSSRYTLQAGRQYGTLTALGMPDKSMQPEFTQDYHLTISESPVP